MVVEQLSKIFGLVTLVIDPDKIKHQKDIGAKLEQIEIQQVFSVVNRPLGVGLEDSIAAAAPRHHLREPILFAEKPKDNYSRSHVKNSFVGLFDNDKEFIFSHFFI